jgi:polysaccharide biosynthesis/export protein
MKNLLLLISLSLSLGACAKQVTLGGNGVGDNKVQVVQGDALPPPERADLFAQDRPYMIGPFDKLTIDVFGIEELSNKEVQTDAGGRISFPLAGVIDTAGKTPAELEDIIEERLRGRYVRNPQVSVNLKETVSQVVTVDGEVKEPGLYPVIGRMTLMRAVATAKGTSELADTGSVIIYRTVKGQKMAALYNLKSIRRGVYEDPEVFANDVVVVSDSQRQKLLKNMPAYLGVLATPLILLLQSNGSNP